MTSLDQSRPTTFEVEPYTDSRGVTVNLPPDLLVSECCWCHRVQTRRRKVQACGYLHNLYLIGKLGLIAGESDMGRPYCHDCAPDLGAAEARMPLQLFGGGDEVWDSVLVEGATDNAARLIEEVRTWEEES